MAGYHDQPSRWRLRYPRTVPAKLQKVEGEFEIETGNVTMTLLLPSSELVQFLTEAFPPPIMVGRVAVPQSISLPGLPGLILKKVSFRAFDDGKPVDPFGWDSNAASGTYGEMLTATVTFGPRVNQQPDANDPKTFLEISANGTGEFIHSTAPKAAWVEEDANPENMPDEEDPGAEVDPEEQAPLPDPQESPPVEGEKTAVKDPTIPMNIIVPHTEWVVRWTQVPYYYFYNVLCRRLRWCLGRVNIDVMPLLFNAVPETILFTGYSYKNAYSWRDGNVSTPPVEVEMKFLEKRVVWNGIVRGHNHFWRPGKGWTRLLIDGTNPSYQPRDMNILWDDT